MTTRTKILIDRYLGTPLVWSLNLLARLLGAILKRDHSVAADGVCFIAVSKYVGIGSIIHATPLLQTLRRKYPRAEICFVTAISNRKLTDRLESIDKALYVDDSRLWRLGASVLRVVAYLASQRPDLYFDLEVYSAFACCMALCSLARNRIGFYRYSSRFKKGIYTHLVYFNTRRPIARIYSQLSAAVGVTADQTVMELGRLSASPAERRDLGNKMTSAGLTNGLSSQYVVMNPNASDLLIERRWPLENFAAVASALADRGIHVFVTGSSSEMEYCAGLARHLSCARPEMVRNFAGQLTFGEFLALIAGASCVITNDTGPFHIALALNRPVVGLFGPGDPCHYGMEKGNVVHLYKAIYCSPCLYELDEPACRGHNFCMKAIHYSEVLNAVSRLSDVSGFSLARTIEDLYEDRYRESYQDLDGRPLGVIVRSSVELDIT